MAGIAQGIAQGTVDSLLGLLSSVLLEEGQLLSGVRGDVQFIKDEMEIMNGFLLDLANVDNTNNQVRAWTRQVRDLAIDSQNCIDRYVQCLGARDPAAGGLLGCLRQVPHSARTMPTRHRIATQIRELKSRARELAERRLRYGIKVPALAAMPQTPVVGDGAKEEEGEEERRRLADVTEILDEHVREVIGWLTEKLGGGDRRGRRLRVIAITRKLFQEKEHSLARRVFDHPCASSWFDCKAWINGVRRNTPRKVTLQRVLRQLGEPEEVVATTLGEEQLVEKIKGHLEGKRFLIVAADDPYGLVRGEIESACVPAAGSAIIVTAGKNWKPPQSSVPYKSKDYISLETFRGNALALAGGEDRGKSALVKKILQKCNGNLFCTEMFLRALYVNPSSTEVELNNLLRTPIALASEFKARRMVQFCYSGLPSHHKRCLLYLSIFPEDFEIRRTSLVRRWAAENLIARRDGTSKTDESERCFSALVAWGLVRPFNIGEAGKVKSCKVHPHVLSFIAEIAKDENASNTGLPPELAHRLGILSEIQLQKRSKEDANSAEPPNTCWNWSICKHLIPTYLQGSKAPSNSTEAEALIESLQASSLSGSVRVLNLEGCPGLNNRHVKVICNKIFQLKYLSLRDTDVDDLPNEIENLRYLETLDIRQTKVRASATKSIVLRKLKHLLAGSIHSPSEEFSTVHLPRGIGHMTDLQILSHVEVSNSENEVVDVGQLRQLRKLGVVLRGKEAFPKHLLQVISKLNECLCSLSVRMVAEDETPHDLSSIEDTFLSPKSLVSLSISGGIIELPDWIGELDQLSKITLRGTRLRDTNALCILGNLARLDCLRLRDESYMKSKITFNKGEFQSLKFLVVEGSEIQNIHFVDGAAPKLEKITWSFTEMEQPPSGVEHLPGLKEIVLNGDCDARPIIQLIQDMAAHPNHPVVTHHPIRETTAGGNILLHSRLEHLTRNRRKVVVSKEMEPTVTRTFGRLDRSHEHELKRLINSFVREKILEPEKNQLGLLFSRVVLFRLFLSRRRAHARHKHAAELQDTALCITWGAAGWCSFASEEGGIIKAAGPTRENKNQTVIFSPCCMLHANRNEYGLRFRANIK